MLHFPSKCCMSNWRLHSSGPERHLQLPACRVPWAPDVLQAVLLEKLLEDFHQEDLCSCHITGSAAPVRAGEGPCGPWGLPAILPQGLENCTLYKGTIFICHHIPVKQKTVTTTKPKHQKSEGRRTNPQNGLEPQ